MSLKSAFLYFPMILCLTVCILVVSPYNVLGGSSLTKTTEDPICLDTEMITTFLGKHSIPSFIAQVDLPLAFLPTGVPIVRPTRGHNHTTYANKTKLLGSLTKLIEQREPDRPPKLIQESEPDPRIVYVVPFTRVMVPDEVYHRIFDQFVDTMNRHSASLGLHFVILKQGAEQVGPDWLDVRKYITGEIYSYVEDSGAHYTEIRTKARITYHHPSQKKPLFTTSLPALTFFDRNKFDINVERIKMAESIATTLTEKLLPAFDASLISKRSPKTNNNGV